MSPVFVQIIFDLFRTEFMLMRIRMRNYFVSSDWMAMTGRGPSLNRIITLPGTVAYFYLLPNKAHDSHRISGKKFHRPKVGNKKYVKE